MPRFDELSARLAEMTRKQRSIAEYILSAPEEAAWLSLRALSERVGASEVSVLRVCRALGFNSFVALKQCLREHTLEAVRAATPSPSLALLETREDGSREDSLRAVCADDLKNVSDMVAGLDAERLFACARGLLAAEEVFVFAHDASRLFADYLCYRLEFLRIKATSVKLGDSDTMQTTLARLKERDYAVLLSFPPYHLPIYNVASYCRYRGTPILAITDSAGSPAAAEGADVFLCGTAARYFYNSQVATVSFINILTSCMAIELGEQFDAILADEQDVIAFLREGERLFGRADGPSEA